MARARESHAWDHTCELLALIRNVNRAPDARAITAEQIHPYRAERAAAAAAAGRTSPNVKGPAVTKVPLSILRDIFIPPSKQPKPIGPPPPP